MRSWLLVLTVACFLAGCQAERTLQKPSLTEKGEIFLYLRPFPKESGGLKFSLAQVSAVKDDGGEYPLALSITDFNLAAIKRQRFLAAGELPPGNYVALTTTVTGATLLDEEGEQRLLVPEKPVQIQCRFMVTREKATFLSLAFRYDQSVREGYGFSPVFSVVLPGKPVTGLIGYVSNYGSNTLTVFDKQYNEVVGVIATGAGPMGMAFDQQRRRAYVALAGEDAVEVIDIVTGDVINRIRLKMGDAPRELALSPDGKLLLTVNPGSNTVSVVDPLSFWEMSRISVGDKPTSILIDPNGVRAYVFNSLSQNISVIDIASRSVAALTASEPGVSRGQFDRNGDTLYTIHELSSYIRLVNPFSFALIKRYRVGLGMSFIKVDTLNNLIYTGRKNGPDVEVYEPTTFIPISTIPTDGGPVYMTIDGELNNLYAINGDKNRVEVINLVTREVVAEFDAGEGPYWLSLMGER
jgi:YVTN family beta-propeller protein